MITKDKKKKYVVQSSSPLSEAMALIEENNHRSLIVESAAGVVVGTISDGDIRKAMLDGRILKTPVSSVMNVNFIALSAGEKARAKEYFDKEHIFLIPVIDEKSRLIDIIEAY